MDNTGYSEPAAASSLEERVKVHQGKIGILTDIVEKMLDIMEIRQKTTKRVFALHRAAIVGILVIQVLVALMVVYKI